MQFYFLRCLLPKAGLSQFGQIFETFGTREIFTPDFYISQQILDEALGLETAFLATASKGQGGTSVGREVRERGPQV